MIDLVTTAATEFLQHQIDAGAEAVQLFESWAGLLPEPFFRRWCVEPVTRIVAALHESHPGTPVIAFPRMAGLLYDGYAEATRADCIGLDTTVPLHWAAQAIQQRLGRCIQGNLDPMVLLEGGAAKCGSNDLARGHVVASGYLLVHEADQRLRQGDME